jgi:hypothetical protein
VAVSAVVDFISGLPTNFRTSANTAVYVTWSSDVTTRHALYALLFLILGLAVLVSGAAQFLNARKKDLVMVNSLN